MAFAYRMILDEQMAQDVVQEAFLRLRDRLAEVEQPRAWLYTTVRRLVIDQIRKTKNIVPFASGGDDARELDPVDSAARPDESTDREECAGLLRICLERLQPRERALVQLKFVEELSYKEMSARLGMTVGHVGYGLHHALKSLETELNKEGFAG